jgi:hypothetical protein
MQKQENIVSMSETNGEIDKRLEASIRKKVELISAQKHILNAVKAPLEGLTAVPSNTNVLSEKGHECVNSIFTYTQLSGSYKLASTSSDGETQAHDLTTFTKELWDRSVDLTWSNIPELAPIPLCYLNQSEMSELKDRLDKFMAEAEITPLPRELNDSFESMSDVSNTNINLDDSHPF